MYELLKDYQRGDNILKASINAGMHMDLVSAMHVLALCHIRP